MADAIVPDYSQTYKHIFTSPSSVDKVMKATRSGNARIHGMTQVTSPSIVYIATQVWSSPEACLISSGMVYPLFLICILQDRYSHRFRTLLQEYIDSPWRCQWTERGSRASWVVEYVNMWVIQSTFTLFSLLTPSSARFFQTIALACMHWQRTVCCQESRKSELLLKQQQQLSLHRTWSVGWSPCSLLTFGSVNQFEIILIHSVSCL